MLAWAIHLGACVRIEPDGLLCSIALIVQIHLQQNRTDLALKEVTAARKWAQDNLLVNIAESWVGLRVVNKSLPLLAPQLRSQR